VAVCSQLGASSAEAGLNKEEEEDSAGLPTTRLLATTTAGAEAWRARRAAVSSSTAMNFAYRARSAGVARHCNQLVTSSWNRCCTNGLTPGGALRCKPMLGLGVWEGGVQGVVEAAGATSKPLRGASASRTSPALPGSICNVP